MCSTLDRLEKFTKLWSRNMQGSRHLY